MSEPTSPAVDAAAAERADVASMDDVAIEAALRVLSWKLPALEGGQLTWTAADRIHILTDHRDDAAEIDRLRVRSEAEQAVIDAAIAFKTARDNLFPKDEYGEDGYYAVVRPLCAAVEVLRGVEPVSSPTPQQSERPRFDPNRPTVFTRDGLVTNQPSAPDAP